MKSFWERIRPNWMDEEPPVLAILPPWTPSEDHQEIPLDALGDPRKGIAVLTRGVAGRLPVGSIFLPRDRCNIFANSDGSSKWVLTRGEQASVVAVFILQRGPNSLEVGYNMSGPYIGLESSKLFWHTEPPTRVEFSIVVWPR